MMSLRIALFDLVLVDFTTAEEIDYAIKIICENIGKLTRHVSIVGYV